MLDSHYCPVALKIGDKIIFDLAGHSISFETNAGRPIYFSDRSLARLFSFIKTKDDFIVFAKAVAEFCNLTVMESSSAGGKIVFQFLKNQPA